VCAGRLAENGLSVVLGARELVGWECSFYARMPSKALLRPAQAEGSAGGSFVGHGAPGTARIVVDEDRK
jgi:dihydrolipoamide dehydrogenase